MAQYRLLKGTYAEGEGEDARYFRARDPRNNVVESDLELDKIAPGKFEKYDGPRPSFRQSVGGPQPPGPPSEADQALARLAGPLSPQELEAEEKKLKEALASIQQRKESAAQAESSEEEEDAESDDDNLESLTVAELRELAEKEEVDLAGLSRKDQIIEAIRSNRNG